MAASRARNCRHSTRIKGVGRCAWPHAPHADRPSVMARGRACLQPAQPVQGVLPAGAAHVLARLQGAAYRRTFRAPEQPASVVFIELDAADSRRLALGHARNRAGDGGRDAACGASGTTVHGVGTGAGRMRSLSCAGFSSGRKGRAPWRRGGRGLRAPITIQSRQSTSGPAAIGWMAPSRKRSALQMRRTRPNIRLPQMR